MENEIWKDIEGYERLYQVSNFGRVKSLARIEKSTKQNPRTLLERIMNPRIDSKGYARVSLYNGKYKSLLVHRLVAIAFIPNPDNLPIINHKDENPSNNHVDNLEWCTYKYNNNYGTSSARMALTLRNKVNPMLAIIQYDMEGNYIREFKNMASIKRELGFDDTSICRACKGKYKQSHGFIWRYKLTQ